MAAVEKGIQYHEGVYEYFDPGIPLVVLRDLLIVREKSLIIRDHWYDHYTWAKCQDCPQKQTLRIPMEESFNKTFPEKEQLLEPGEEIASSRSIITFLVIHALSMSDLVLWEHSVACIDKKSEDSHVLVGFLSSEGFYLDFGWDKSRYRNIGIAIVRKS